MDIVLGLIFWGGLLLVVLSWIGRTGLTSHRRHSHGGAPSRSGSWSSTAPPAGATPDRVPRARQAELREDEALADGLVIGHYLTRDHYRYRIAGLEHQIEELTLERDRWHEAAAGDDLLDELDDAEFDAMGGFGVEPWADDLYDHDDH